MLHMRLAATLSGEGRLIMTVTHEPTRESLELAEQHAAKAEKLLRSWWLSSHVKGQLHATLALYYATRRSS
jgi:hypothetical protein